MKPDTRPQFVILICPCEEGGFRPTVPDTVVVRHLYIERRLTPLNLFLERADDALKMLEARLLPVAIQARPVAELRHLLPGASV